MTKFVELPLKTETGKSFYYSSVDISSIQGELDSFLDGLGYDTIDFATNVLFPSGIKTNNTIEGIKYPLPIVEDTITGGNLSIGNIINSRILNLFRGYNFIISNSNICKESLKQLYSILSCGLLSDHDLHFMGEYYRTAKVDILLNGHNVDNSCMRQINSNESKYANPYSGIDPSKIDEFTL